LNVGGYHANPQSCRLPKALWEKICTQLFRANSYYTPGQAFNAYAAFDSDGFLKETLGYST
jgi:hypothetical protein